MIVRKVPPLRQWLISEKICILTSKYAIDVDREIAVATVCAAED